MTKVRNSILVAVFCLAPTLSQASIFTPMTKNREIETFIQSGQLNNLSHAQKLVYLDRSLESIDEMREEIANSRTVTLNKSLVHRVSLGTVAAFTSAAAATSLLQKLSFIDTGIGRFLVQLEAEVVVGSVAGMAGRALESSLFSPSERGILSTGVFFGGATAGAGIFAAVTPFKVISALGTVATTTLSIWLIKKAAQGSETVEITPNQAAKVNATLDRLESIILDYRAALEEA